MTRFCARNAYILMVSQMRALIRNRASISFRLRSKTLEPWNRDRVPYEQQLANVYDHGSFWQSLDLEFESCLWRRILVCYTRPSCLQSDMVCNLKLKFQAISDIQRFNLPIIPTNNSNSTTDSRASSICPHHNIALLAIGIWQGLSYSTMTPKQNSPRIKAVRRLIASLE